MTPEMEQVSGKATSISGTASGGFVPLDVTQRRSWSAAFETVLQLEVPLAGPLLERQGLIGLVVCQPNWTGHNRTGNAIEGSGPPKKQA